MRNIGSTVLSTGQIVEPTVEILQKVKGVK